MKNLLAAFAAIAVAVFVAAGSTTPSDAAPRAAANVRVFDGLWSVSIVTTRGDCDRGYRYPVRIFAGRVMKADTDPVYTVVGAVARNGNIVVTVSGGGKSANGRGRLSRGVGGGVWSTSTGQCSGEWTAERRGS